jgi:hypothetical protein
MRLASNAAAEATAALYKPPGRDLAKVVTGPNQLSVADLATDARCSLIPIRERQAEIL